MTKTVRQRAVYAYSAEDSCSVDRCTTRPRARGLCGVHYQRWRAFGNPLQVTSTRAVPASSRFWRQVAGGDVTGCWRWQGGHKHNGYGVFHAQGRQVLAHRFAYADLISPIPADLQLDHLCRTRDCVNPWHLDPVTPAINSQRRSAVAQ